MAVRGSPAKGVGWGNWREGSNPSFSAKKSIRENALFSFHILFESYKKFVEFVIFVCVRKMFYTVRKIFKENDMEQNNHLYIL